MALERIAENQRYKKTRATGFAANPVVVSDVNPIIDAVNALSGNVTPPLRYVALLAQAGTAAPTATVLENTLGGTVVWTRVAAGNYRGTLTGAFTLNKTYLISGTGTVFNNFSS